MQNNPEKKLFSDSNIQSNSKQQINKTRNLQSVTLKMSAKKRETEIKQVTRSICNCLFYSFLMTANAKAITLQHKVIAFISSFDSFYMVKR